MIFDVDVPWNLQNIRGISAIIVTGDYLFYKEPKGPSNVFFLF